MFAHEYGHDLGLPDEYDTAGGADNAVNWWTLMAQSRVSAASDQGIGTRAADLGAWDKLQLGWLDYEVVVAGQNRTLDLGPHEYNTRQGAGRRRRCCRRRRVTHDVGAPAAGTKQWWSGTGDDYDATLTRQVAIPAGHDDAVLPGALEHRGLRAGRVRLRLRRGRRRHGLQGDPRLDHQAPPRATASTATSGGYKPATFDLSAYAGKTVSLRFHYKTDGGAAGQPGRDRCRRASSSTRSS